MATKQTNAQALISALSQGSNVTAQVVSEIGERDFSKWTILDGFGEDTDTGLKAMLNKSDSSKSLIMRILGLNNSRHETMVKIDALANQDVVLNQESGAKVVKLKDLSHAPELYVPAFISLLLKQLPSVLNPRTVVDNMYPTVLKSRNQGGSIISGGKGLNLVNVGPLLSQPLGNFDPQVSVRTLRSYVASNSIAGEILTFSSIKCIGTATVIAPSEGVPSVTAMCTFDLLVDENGFTTTVDETSFTAFYIANNGESLSVVDCKDLFEGKVGLMVPSIKVYGLTNVDMFNTPSTDNSRQGNRYRGGSRRSSR